MAAKKSRRSRGDGALFYRADRDRSIGRISVNGTPRTVSARTKTEARYKLDQLRRAADDGLPVITRDRTVAELLELWRTKALPNRDLSPAASPATTGPSASSPTNSVASNSKHSPSTTSKPPSPAAPSPPTSSQLHAKVADGQRRAHSPGTRSSNCAPRCPRHSPGRNGATSSPATSPPSRSSPPAHPPAEPANHSASNKHDNSSSVPPEPSSKRCGP